MLAQILVAQAPAPQARAARRSRSGSGRRTGWWVVEAVLVAALVVAVAVAAVVGWGSGSSGRSRDPHGGWQARLHRILDAATKTNINNGSRRHPQSRDRRRRRQNSLQAGVGSKGRQREQEPPVQRALYALPPAGVPTNFGIQMGFQAVQDKNAIVFGWDTGGATRVIYLDRRKHLHPGIKLYQGDSIGKFEGDVLTVETRNQMAGWWDAIGAVHSDQVHVIEKFTFRDSNTIGYEAVVTDPVALTRPMTVTDTFRRNANVPLGFRGRPGGLYEGHTGYEQTETACVEGEQDLQSIRSAAAAMRRKASLALMRLRARCSCRWRPAAVAVVLAALPVAAAAVVGGAPGAAPLRPAIARKVRKGGRQISAVPFFWFERVSRIRLHSYGGNRYEVLGAAAACGRRISSSLDGLFICRCSGAGADANAARGNESRAVL